MILSGFWIVLNIILIILTVILLLSFIVQYDLDEEPLCEKCFSCFPCVKNFFSRQRQDSEQSYILQLNEVRGKNDQKKSSD